MPIPNSYNGAILWGYPIVDNQATSINFRRRMLTIGLWILLFAAALGLRLTPSSDSLGSSPDISGRYARPIVDERPVQTAHVTARLASNSDERLFAEEAVQLADHEVDLAFADALRDAVEHPLPPTPQTKVLYSQQEKASAQINADQDQVDEISKRLGEVSTAQKKALQPQLDLAKAQLELDQDELDDIKQDLARTGADAVSRIQHQIDRHNLAHQHGVDSSSSTAIISSGSEADYNASNVVAQVAAYYALSRKVTPLRQAHQEVSQGIMALFGAHDRLQMVAASRTVGRQNDPKQQPAPGATLATLREQSFYEHSLASIEKRIQDEQELAGVYGDWSNLLLRRQRIASYGVIRSMLWIVLIVPATYFSGKAAERLLMMQSRKHPQWANFRVLVRFAWQAAGVLLILMVIFGVPAQVPAAIFGIIGAGLTVALKDLAGSFIDTRLRGLVSAYSKPSMPAADTPPTGP